MRIIGLDTDEKIRWFPGTQMEKRLKRGDTREDGMVFWGYNNQGRNEVWVTEEKKQALLKVKREQAKKMLEASPEYRGRQHENARSWREKNRERYCAHLRGWRKKNPGYTTARNKEDGHVGRASSVRSALGAALKKKGVIGDQNLRETVAWIKWLKIRLGYPDATVDHLRPLSLIPLSTPEDVRYANSVENTWVLSATDNRKKNRRMPTEVELEIHSFLFSEYHATVNISPTR